MSHNASASVLQAAVPVNSPVQSNNEHISSDSKIETLVIAIQTLKAEQKAIGDEVAKMEQELIDICGVKEEGASKFDTQNFIITTTGKLTRKVTDVKSLEGIAPEVLKVEKKLDVRKLKALATSNPMLYQRALQCIESKPAKAGIAIKAREVA